MQLRAPFAKPISHEEFFLSHYDRLVRRAFQLSQGRRGEAKDLVHDLYVQLIRACPEIDFTDEERASRYLLTMLRNLSVSKARREGRDALSSLLIVDYESVESGIASIDRSRLVLVRSDLARVCEYACIRRHTSRSASVLILRFFFGYYPSEIVRILKTTRAAVEKHLQAARQEARVYLESPAKLRFLGQDVTPDPIAKAFLPDDPLALMRELRNRILTGAKGKCLSSQTVEERYIEGAPVISIAEFAHIVSCSTCLERTNHTLGLPSLAERSPSDMIDREGGGNEPPPSSGSGTPDAIALNKRVRQVYEHMPTKLQIAVDGEIRAAQLITSKRSELQVQLEPLAQPAFLEVFSEQGVRLLYLQIEELSAGDLQPYAATAELSDGRSIELKLNFASGVVIVSSAYYNPQLEEQVIGNSDMVAAASRGDGPADSFSPPFALRKAPAVLGRFLRSCFPSFDSLLPLGMVAAATAFLALGLNHWLKESERGPSLPSARALLARSQQMESAQIAKGGAIHTTYSLETLTQDGKVLDSKKVDRWKSAVPKRTALRLTDNKGDLVTGRWSDAKGKVTHYTRKSGLLAALRKAEASPGFGNVWELTPDVELPLLAGLDKSEVQRSGDDYEIRYAPSHSPATPGLTRASLVLESSAMRPIREVLTLQENGESREYRFRQLTYEVIPASRVQDNDFAPPVELTSFHSGLGRPLESGDRSAHLMLEALQLLSNLGAEVEQIVNVVRTPSGGVEINGVFPTSEQRASVGRVFQSLRANGQVKIALHSGDEAQVPRDRPQAIRVESLAPVALDSQHIPFDAELRSALVSQGLDGQALEERIRQVANRAFRTSAQVHREAWFIRQIAANDFLGNELQSMEPEDKMLWLTLLDMHLRSFDQELTSLNADFAPLFPDQKARLPVVDSGISSLRNTHELGAVAAVLDHDAEQLDQILTAGLTLSPQNPQAKPDPQDIAPLLAALRTNGATLHRTIDRLQTFGQAEIAK